MEHSDENYDYRGTQEQVDEEDPTTMDKAFLDMNKEFDDHSMMSQSEEKTTGSFEEGVFGDIDSTDSSAGNSAKLIHAAVGVGSQDHQASLNLHHRHDLPDLSKTHHETPYSLSGLIWFIVILHLIGLGVWLRAWLVSKKRNKEPLFKGQTPGPPPKQGITYDMDRSISATNLLELAKQSLNPKVSQA